MILQNEVLLCGILSWFMAQLLKIPSRLITEHTMKGWNFFGSGGMPSSHTALVVSTAIMTGVKNGYDSPLFGLAMIFAMVVMYDATGVRRETGRQGKVLNEILRHLVEDGKPVMDVHLRELVGHSPLQVFFGALTGLAVSGIWILLS